VAAKNRVIVTILLLIAYYSHWIQSVATRAIRALLSGPVMRGHSAKAIARSLVIATETARNHLIRIYSKLGVTSQAELFFWNNHLIINTLR
jgi:hypothetical protein